MIASEISPELANSLMDAALAQAKLAALAQEVPVGAVIYRKGEVLSAAHNLCEKQHDCSAHAEILAIRAASQKLNNWRLEDCILAVTLEPCTMCIGAIKLARIPTLVFGVKDPRLGAVGSLYDLSASPPSNADIRVIQGVKEAECRKVLQDFFASRRNQQ